ncbi:DUF3352 domain-containing protein [Herbidospora sp. NEAU-GS84]|uniref:DUF3352 domain-containing protein n=1 Tax=Herbidospora solisilvae TaxID=2696284 RepID=A0A7C9NJE9_9ACTN|nr:DUF3352 domain-containing protein [Herbidospora solisilvae]NAS24112.1 DUF3352 domain-containing protein [Herbidospora solisilvae]
MPAENPPGFPFDVSGGDPDRTINYRTPQQQPQPHVEPTRIDFGGTQQMYAPQQPPQQGQWRQPEELGYDLPPVVHAPVQKRGPKGAIIAVIVAVLVGLVGGGGVWAFSALSGGGAQPAEVLPAGALAYARIDLDPAANQKLALFGIARKFTATKDAFSGDDPREALFKAISSDNENFKDIDYAADIEPWLGDRIGFAVMPGKDANEPGFALAIQVKDANAARAGIAKLDAGSGTKTGMVIRGDYAIVSPTQAEADRYATGPTLAESANFTADMEALGEPGVLSFWGDLGQLAAMGGAQVADPALTDQLKNGRFAGALRFDGSYAELAAITRGVKSPVTVQTSPVKLGELPDTTAGALAISGLGEGVKGGWDQIVKSVESTGGGAQFSQFVTQAQQQFGLTLPDDLATLLGDSITVAIDSQGLDGNMPNAGAVLATDPAKAGEVLTKVEQALAVAGQPLQLAKAPGEGKLVVATNQDYANKLAAGGTLADSETFQTAVPNADSAGFGLFVDLDKIENLYLQGMSEEDKANLQVLRAVGMSGGTSGSDANFSLRVLFN